MKFFLIEKVKGSAKRRHGLVENNATSMEFATEHFQSIGIYQHEFTNNGGEISIPVLKISSSLLVNECR